MTASAIRRLSRGQGGGDGGGSMTGGSAEARAAATGGLDDGERSAMSRGWSRNGGASEPGHGYGGEVGGQLIVGSRDETVEGGNGDWRGNRGGRDDQATSGTMPAPGDWGGAAGLTSGETNGGGKDSTVGSACKSTGKRKRGKRLEMLMYVVSAASGARRRCKESRRCEETLRNQN